MLLTKKIGQAINFLTILNGKKDLNAGAKFYKKNGSYIHKGDLILKFFSNSYENLKIAKNLIDQSYLISND